MKFKFTVITLALAAAVFGSTRSAFALEPASSPSYRISYAAIAPGGVSLSGTNFKAPATGTGQNLTLLQSSQQLPVALSSFTVE